MKTNPTQCFTKKNEFGFALFGGPGGIRTLDLSDANRTLSQLSYAPTRLVHYSTFFTFVKAFFSSGAFLCEKAPKKKIASRSCAIAAFVVEYLHVAIDKAALVGEPAVSCTCNPL